LRFTHGSHGSSGGAGCPEATVFDDFGQRDIGDPKIPDVSDERSVGATSAAFNWRTRRETMLIRTLGLATFRRASLTSFSVIFAF